ncbi:MAG: hypothetical protein ABIH87_01145 [bacterium]
MARILILFGIVLVFVLFVVFAIKSATETIAQKNSDLLLQVESTDIEN